MGTDMAPPPPNPKSLPSAINCSHSGMTLSKALSQMSRAERREGPLRVNGKQTFCVLADGQLAIHHNAFEPPIAIIDVANQLHPARIRRIAGVGRYVELIARKLAHPSYGNSRSFCFAQEFQIVVPPEEGDTLEDWLADIRKAAKPTAGIEAIEAIADAEYKNVHLKTELEAAKKSLEEASLREERLQAKLHHQLRIQLEPRSDEEDKLKECNRRHCEVRGNVGEVSSKEWVYLFRKGMAKATGMRGFFSGKTAKEKQLGKQLKQTGSNSCSVSM